MRFFRTLILAFAVVFSSVCFAQKAPKYTIDDVNRICETVQGIYKAKDGDTAAMTLRIIPLQNEAKAFRFYAELCYDSISTPIEQKVFDIVPISSKVFTFVIHNMKDGTRFAHADKATLNKIAPSDLKGKRKHTFYNTKTSDYQTNWQGHKAFKSVKSGDRLHYKFSNEEGRFYVKRVPYRSTRILGITFVKQED